MDIAKTLENAMHEYFRGNNNLPMPHGQFLNEIYVHVYQAAIISGMGGVLVQKRIGEEIKRWIEKGLCVTHGGLGDIELTAKGHAYFTSLAT